MKKLLSYLLVIALVLVQFMPLVSAAETTGEIKITTPESETVNGAINYNIYKIFDLSLNTDATAYRYTVEEGTVWYTFFKTGAGKDYVTLTESTGTSYVVTWKEGKDSDSDMATLAKAALAYAKEENIAATKTATIEQNGTETTVTGLELGYYLVDSSLGALVALTTTNRTGEINEKNTPPTIDKVIVEGTQELDKSNGNIGDVVNYQVEIFAKKGAQDYVLIDTMTSGLSFNNDVKVTVGETELTQTTDYTVELGTGSDEYTFKVKFTETYLESITEDTTIVVTYSATINQDAVINEDGNKNEAKLTYGDDLATNVDYTKTYVLAFDLIKNDANSNELKGAKFELYRSETGGTPIQFVMDGEVYRVATTTEINDSAVTKVTEIEVGSARIEGLDAGTYYLEETVAPEGYNKLTSRVKVTLKDVADEENSEYHHTELENYESTTVKYADDDVTVINTTGSLLPSTGGIGTVLFVTIGSIMVLGFGVLLVTKLRLSKMEI